MDNAQFQARAAKIVTEYERFAVRYKDAFAGPIARPHDMERVLRADLLTNEAEGKICGIKVQIRLADTSGEKPYLILEIEGNPITARASICVRDDRVGSHGHYSSIEMFDLQRCTSGDLSNALAMQHAILLLERDGYAREAGVLTGMLKCGGRGQGWTTCTSRVHALLRGRYHNAPEYDQSPLIREGKMEVGRWYCVVDGDRFTMLRFGGYSEHFTDTRHELWVRHDKTEVPIELRLSDRVITDGPSRSDRGCHISRKYQGKVFAVPEKWVRELEAFISPQFDESINEQIGMPIWDKPLDTTENCLERIRTGKYGYDREQYNQAVLFLFEHRAELTEPVAITVPSMPGNSWWYTDEAQGQHLIANTEAGCGCGVHRRIMPGKSTTTSDAGVATHAE